MSYQPLNKVDKFTKRLSTYNWDKLPSHCRIAYAFVGQREYWGYNRSYWIDRINGNCKVSKGSSYCQSSVIYWLDSAFGAIFKRNYPHTASALNFKTENSISAAKVLFGFAQVPIGAVITWQHGKTAFGHAGFAVDTMKNEEIMTIQANTNKNKEDRDGDGIFEKPARIEPLRPFRIIRFTPIKYELL